MPALFFPNPDALRLVLASGVLPAAVTAAPARAGWDDHGRLWLDPAAPLPRVSLAALGRFGVQTLGGGEPTPVQVGSWAELLPLQKSDIAVAGPVLFELPDARLARFVRALTHGGAQPVGVRLLPGVENVAWVRCDRPPARVLARVADGEGEVEPFVEQVPGVWVRAGWEHPFPEGFTLPPGHVLLLRPPRSVTFHAGLPPAPALPDLPLLGDAPLCGVAKPLPPIPVALRLRRSRADIEPALWVFPSERAAEFRRVVQEAGERALTGYEVAECHAGVVVRRKAGDAPALPLPDAGYAADPRAAGLLIPVGWALRPPLRAAALVRVLGLSTDRVTWIDPGPDGEPLPRSVPAAAFRPLTAWVEYSAPATRRFAAAPLIGDPFPLARIVEAGDAPAEIDEPDLTITPFPQPPEAPIPPPEKRGWLARSIERLTGRRSAAPPREPAPTGAKPAPPPPRSPSADSLLHGAERAARRKELEARLVRDSGRLGPAQRAAAWAELATVYKATGNPADAAVCWTNAVWEADPPPADWLDQWYAAECLAARRPTADPLDRWLSEPGRFGAARVVAAYTARAALGSQPAPELAPVLPKVLALLDQQFDDLPARAAWLAGVAAARAGGGDALGLARWRDRLVARLREKGPGLDLDEPSFLRFHGTASPERFQTAKDWLIRVKKPVVEWVERLGPTGRLQGVGMDAETHCTAAYAQLMLAWGLGCLGERGRSLDWAARARKVLGRASGPGVDPAAHAVLSGLFADRIRGVQDGRPSSAGIPADLRAKYDALAPLARYAVDRLRDHSRVLEPVGGGLAFRGLDVRQFRGTDRLGERLQLLADETDAAAVRAEARELLDVCAADPCSTTVPRVTLTLLEAAGALAEPDVREALGHAVPAATWLDAWLRAGKWPDPDRADRHPKYLARLFSAAAGAAARFGLAAEARPLAEFLARRAGGDAAVRAAVVRGAGAVFRAFRKLGFASETAAILDQLDPGRGAWPADAPLPPPRLGLAVGWFAAGDEDAATRLLDDARHRLLFAPRAGDDRDRTELAIGYADALGFAPPRIALGRLEELFQQLDRVTTTGTTNRYYTLKPLELVDTVVRAVVTDEFSLSPAVRGWLADDEFLIRRRVHRDVAAALRGEGG